MKATTIHAAIAFVAVAVALLAYITWYGVIAAKSGAVAELEGRIQVKTEAESRIAATRAALSRISADELQVRQYFVPEMDAVTFIEDLEARGKMHEAAVTVLSVSAGKAQESVLVLNLSLVGTFEAVMRALGSIEYAPYAISVSNLTVERAKEDSWRATVELTAGSLPAASTKP